jgi:hypothetical protein
LDAVQNFHNTQIMNAAATRAGISRIKPESKAGIAASLPLPGTSLERRGEFSGPVLIPEDYKEGKDLMAKL